MATPSRLRHRVYRVTINLDLTDDPTACKTCLFSTDITNRGSSDMAAMPTMADSSVLRRAEWRPAALRVEQSRGHRA
jgi:hypothetical protein